VEREADLAERPSVGIFDWLRFNWVPRVAIASVLVGAGIISVQQIREASKREQIARDVAAVSSAATLPPQWLQDFDAINVLSQPSVDEELLAALQ
jgi:hypothetical protein